MHLFAILIVLLSGFSVTSAETIIIPLQHETIQEGIDASADTGDVIIVLPGEYEENIDFNGKGVTIYGIGGADVTILNGSGEGPCVNFTSGEGPGSILAGFTITGGDAGDAGYGGAVHVIQSSPLIAMNIITENRAGRGGGGVSSSGLTGAPTLYRNLFLRNFSERGGAIHVSGGGSAIVMNNTFVENQSDAEGAALYFNLGAFVQFTNNIVVNNESGRGGALFSPMFGGGVLLVRSSYNDVWENQGGNFSGIRRGEGELSEDPLFIDAENANYYLTEDSPCIDRGDPDGLSDFDGSRADIGCYSGTGDTEMEPVILERESLDFGELAVGTERTLSIAMINPNESEITVSWISLPTSSFDAGERVVQLEGEQEFELEITFAPDSISEYTDSLIIMSMEMVELADTLIIPFPIGSSTIRLSGVGVHPESVQGTEIYPAGYSPVTCYPNPFNSSLKIKVTLRRSSEMSLSIFDTGGRMISSLFEGRAQVGDNIITWSPHNLTAGVYIVKWVNGQEHVETAVNYLK